jgi:putative ABC transport system substrate-binding protein
VDIIVAQSTPGCLAARAATATIPIVMAGCAYPEERGLIVSLAQPGGNVTGLTNNPGPEFRGKILELLKEVAPAISRVAILRNPLSPGEAPTPEEVEHEFKSWQTITAQLGLTALNAMVHNTNAYADAFAMFVQKQADAMYVSPTHLNVENWQHILDFATTQQLPTICGSWELVEAGYLMSYWTDWADLRRRSAVYVDKILKGAKPADLPVEQPAKFELAINLKTAKALGLTVPPTILILADKLIR